VSNPADKRLTELLDKWLVSLDLHLKYSSLDEGTYRRIQPWPDHDRPSRWIIDLARQKALQLKEALESRIEMGDAKFSDALELMAFLQNLVGSQHISRFIPLAEPQNEVALAANAGPAPATHAAPAPAPAAPAVARAPAAAHAASEARAGQPAAVATPAAPYSDSTRIAALATQPRKAMQEATATREMPRPVDIATTQSGRKTDTHKIEARKGAARREGKAATTSKGRGEKQEKSNAARELKVVADAVRLLGWGRKWHELPELISRMADRPPVTEVRRILREQKDAIEAQSGD
jgi:hypothetical protein